MTNLSKAKGLGSSKGGSSDWFLQKVTAILLLPLTFLLMIGFIEVLKADSAANISNYFKYRNELSLDWFTHASLITYLLIGFWHGKIGLQVVIEDYVHGHRGKLLLIVLLNILWIFLSFTSVFIWLFE